MSYEGSGDVWRAEVLIQKHTQQELKKHATAEDQVVDVRRPDDSTAGENGGLASVYQWPRSGQCLAFPYMIAGDRLLELCWVSRTVR